jgi:hypothetical protein
VVIQNAFHKIERAPADEHPAYEARPLIGQRQFSVRRERIQSPATTATHVEAWKSPSQSVLVSSPATVVLG